MLCYLKVVRSCALLCAVARCCAQLCAVVRSCALLCAGFSVTGCGSGRVNSYAANVTLYTRSRSRDVETRDRGHIT